METFWTSALWWCYLVLSLMVAAAALMLHNSYDRQLKEGGSPRHHEYIMPVSFALSSALFGGAQMIVHSKAIAELFELQTQGIQPYPVTTWYFYVEFTLLVVCTLAPPSSHVEEPLTSTCPHAHTRMHAADALAVPASTAASQVASFGCIA